MIQAQAGLMAGLNSQQRQELYTKISDDSLAGMLVVMRTPERIKLLQEVEANDQALVDRVLRYIRYMHMCSIMSTSPEKHQHMHDHPHPAAPIGHINSTAALTTCAVNSYVSTQCMLYGRLRPALAAKWLAAMPAEEVLAETEQMTAASVSAALSVMKPQQAANIIQVARPSLAMFDITYCRFTNACTC